MDLSPIDMQLTSLHLNQGLSFENASDIIKSFHSATVNFSPESYHKWYNSAMNLIKIFDETSLFNSDPLSRKMRELPLIILNQLKKPFVKDGFKSTCGAIFNLLLKFKLVDNDFREQVQGFLCNNRVGFSKDSFNSDEDEEKSNEIIDTINQMQEERQKEDHTFDTFVDICRTRNEKNISVAICDMLGKFIICDKMSETIFENKKDELFSHSLFDLMIPLSFEHLRRVRTLQDFKTKKVFTYTIYSPNSKKKYLKMLNKFKNQLASQTNFPPDLKNEPHSQIKGKDLFYKYLKSLTSRITMIEIKMDKEILNELFQEDINQEYPFSINKKHPIIEQIINSKDSEEKPLIVLHGALLETRVAKHIQKFNYLFMKFDPKIWNQEQKIQKKINKFNKKMKINEENQEIFIDQKGENSKDELKSQAGAQSFNDFHEIEKKNQIILQSQSLDFEYSE